MSTNKSVNQNNGSCITVDSNFACKSTCEDFYRELLRLLRLNPETADYVSAEVSTSYETTTLPIGLRNLSAISNELTMCKENFGNERGELESRMYAAKYYDPSNPEFAEFYSSYINPMIEEVKRTFSGNNSNPVNIVSQISFSRLSKFLVNILLMKKPNGSDNIVRRRKAIPESRVEAEDGSVSYRYYSKEEIDEAERELYEIHNAHNHVTLDMAHIPFSFDYLLLSTASLISVKRTPRHSEIVLPTLEEIFTEEEGGDELLNEQFREILTIAKRDLSIIRIVESRGGNIMNIIHADCKGTSSIESASSNHLKMEEIYINLLMYVKMILFIASDLISKVRKYGELPTTSTKIIEMILGIQVAETDEYDNYSEKFIAMLDDENLKVYFSSMPFMFKIDDHLFRILLVNLVRRATINNTHKSASIVDRFASYISYNNSESVFSAVINKFMSEISRIESSISDNLGVISLVKGTVENEKGAKESIVSYAYRTLEHYIDHETGKFGIELAIIDSSLKIVEASFQGKKQTTSRYSILENNAVFSLDALIETVRKLSGTTTLLESSSPFNAYKDELTKKTDSLDAKRKIVSDILDEKYGKSFSKYFVELPPIPYNDTEKLWASNKCNELISLINSIRELNIGFDWDSFREAYINLNRSIEELANSEIEDVTLVQSIDRWQTIFDELSVSCKIDDSSLSKMIEYEKSLMNYSNLDKIKFSFKKFEFSYNKSLELEMDYSIGKSFVIHNDTLTPIQSIISNKDFFTILDSYFRPFFESFATINSQLFNISFKVVERMQNKMRPGQLSATSVNQLVSDVIMTVKFGSSEDVHVCSKFRTHFYCIKETKRLFEEAKKKSGSSVDLKDFSYSDVSSDFMIHWTRTANQSASLSGSAGEKTYKLYDSTRGCIEKYPFYDSNGMNVIRKAFSIASQKYMNAISLRKERENRPKRTAVILDRSSEPGLGKISEHSKKLTDASKSFWSAINQDGSSVDLMKDLDSFLDSSKSSSEKASSIFVRKSQDVRKQPLGRGRTGDTYLVDQRPNEVSHFVRSKGPKYMKDPNNPGWQTATYNQKRIKGFIPAPDDARRSQTPARFVKSLRENSGGRNTFRGQQRSQSPGGNKGTPIFSDRRSTYNRSSSPGGNKGTPIFVDRRQNSGRSSSPNGAKGTPVFIDRGSSPSGKGTPVFIGTKTSTPTGRGNSDSSRYASHGSPSVSKRSGYHTGTQSPGVQSPNYFEPTPSIFDRNIEVPVSRPMGLYPNLSSSSPVARNDETSQLFGVESRPGTDKSDKSSGSSKPQIFDVQNDDDFSF